MASSANSASVFGSTTTTRICAGRSTLGLGRLGNIHQRELTRSGTERVHKPVLSCFILGWQKMEGRGMTDNKTKPTELSVAAFIDTLADEARRTDAKTLLKLMQRATGEKPKMWGSSIIGFGCHHYTYESGREGDMPLAGFSPRKNATVLYGVKGSGESEALLASLGKHTTGKGCLYIKKLSDVDQKVLAALIEKSVAATRLRHST